MKTTIASRNITGKKYTQRLKEKGYRVSSYAEEILGTIEKSDRKEPYTFVIIKASEFSQEYPTTQEIRDEARKRGYITPPAELAPLLREAVSDEDIAALGLTWLVVMHEPVTGSDGFLVLLTLRRRGEGQWLGASYGRPDYGWFREDGFVFLAPQDSLLHSDTSSSSDTFPFGLSKQDLQDYIAITKTLLAKLEEYVKKI